MECGSLPSTVRHAATIACPITCPPNTRCQLVFGLLPRNRFTSSGSRSRIEIRSIRLLDIASLSIWSRGLVSPPVSPSYSELARVKRKKGPMSARRSIVIGGGAFAGLALALALRQGLGADVAVIFADPALATRPSQDPRATAIVAACRRLFETLVLWVE